VPTGIPYTFILDGPTEPYFEQTWNLEDSVAVRQ